MISINPTYSTTVTVTGGRAGHAVSDDGALDVQLRRPKPNGESGGTNPEQLFAAGWGACFQSALQAVAKNAEVDAAESTVAVTVSLGRDESGGFGLAATIDVTLPGLDKVKAQELANAAHAMCPYSRAVHGNIDVVVMANQPGA